ncbi:hypothetical protein [Streptomyces sp. NPDC017673]|uniref:hypothetical protein n=1 Tax=unclassified Streptomyces TaxID=2593676 RepID=UPI0037A1A5F7
MLAATGTALIVIDALVTHARGGEGPRIGPGAVLLDTAGVIAWGRSGPCAR